MDDAVVGRSVSIFFFAGDFTDVLRRHGAGEQQIYATHDEVARLIHDYRDAGVEVCIYSFVTPAAKDERPLDGVRVVSLGAAHAGVPGLLAEAVAGVTSDTIIAAFPNPELLEAAIGSGKRLYAGCANSYNEHGLRAWWRRRRIVRLLNRPEIAMVMNHCVPATEHLAAIGVERAKLVPWDVPHRFDPADHTPKRLTQRDMYEIAYAGSIAELKGVGDIIRVIARLRDEGLQLRASFAGGGDIEAMRALGTKLGVGDRLDFRGIIGNDDAFAMFRAADLVAVPSHTIYPEGFPLTMFEAIASRSPIVCTDHPMFRPIMTDGVNAAMFPSQDVGAFAAAIRRTLTDASLYARLSDNAPDTWAALKGPADWRTLLTKWVVEGKDSPWIAQYALAAR